MKQINPSSATIVEMHSGYPYGELKDASHGQENVLVRKKLVYQNGGQLQIIKKMAQFIANLQSEHLVQLMGWQSQNGQAFFYYQYVPLTLQRWILDLGDDILDELQFQMVSLAGYLTQQGIKFRFDPGLLGLSKEIKVKYFLSEFAIENEAKMNSFKEEEAQITQFFSEFRSRYQKTFETPHEFLDRKSADSALLLNRLQMISKRQSWDGKPKGLTTARSRKNLMLSQKIQNSKKKSMEILQRLRNLKSQPHQ